MAAHGIRNVVLDAYVPAADENGEFHPDWTGLEARMAMALKYSPEPPFAVEMNTNGIYSKYMNGQSIGGHTSGVEMPPAGFFTELTAMVRLIENKRLEEGWPEFLYYPIDEPGRRCRLGRASCGRCSRRSAPPACAPT